MRAPTWLADAVLPGADTARDIGFFTAALLGILAVCRVVWRGLAALVKANELVREQERILAQQREVQQQMVACLAEAKAQARDLDKVENRLERLEELAMRRALAAPSPED